MGETLEKQSEFKSNLGDWLGNSPGRPKGSKNRFTVIKEQMAEIFEEEGGKEAFRKFFKSQFPKALDKIIAIMPKEQEDKSTTNNFYTVIQFESKDTSSSRVSGIDKPLAD